MPRKIVIEDDEVKHRAGAADALDDATERGLAMRILLYSPKDLFAGTVAFGAICAVFINAFFLQPGRHPFPMFGDTVTLLPPSPPPAASPLPRPRPNEAMQKDSRRSDDLQPIEMKPPETRAAVDPIASALKATAPATTSTIRPPAPVAPAHHAETSGDANAPSRRVVAVQKALSQYGYGQLKPTGTVGPETHAAIQKFEREHKLPVTGHVTDQLVRKMAAVTGRPIE